MTIHLHPEMTLLELNNAFQTEFPYLKLECFTQPHHAFEGSPAQYLVKDHAVQLSVLNPAMKAGDVLCSPGSIVRELEDIFAGQFGLFVQVFRKSHEVWLATSATDNLSLAEQNKRGQTAEHPEETPPEILDYREQD